jgi:hypothetical protein
MNLVSQVGSGNWSKVCELLTLEGLKADQCQQRWLELSTDEKEEKH